MCTSSPDNMLKNFCLCGKKRITIGRAVCCGHCAHINQYLPTKSSRMAIARVWVSRIQGMRVALQGLENKIGGGWTLHGSRRSANCPQRDTPWTHRECLASDLSGIFYFPPHTFALIRELYPLCTSQYKSGLCPPHLCPCAPPLPS